MLTEEQVEVARELARREAPLIQQLGEGLRDEALTKYYIAVLRRHERWNDAQRQPGED